MLKNFLGKAEIETIKPSILVSYQQTKLLNETNTSMDANFKRLYDLTNKLNCNIVYIMSSCLTRYTTYHEFNTLRCMLASGLGVE